MSRLLLILTAVEAEARGLARGLGLARVVSSPWPCFARDGTVVLPVGLRASQLEARGLWDRERPALVVSAGACGALSPALGEAGALIVPRTVLAPSGARLTIDPDAHARALVAAAAAGVVAATGPLITTTEIVESSAAKLALWRQTGAIAADMESALIVAAAARRGVPAVVVRAVSDTAAQSLPRDLAGLVDDAGRTSAVRAAALVLRRPAIICSALALQRGTARGLRTIAAVLAKLAAHE